MEFLREAGVFRFLGDSYHYSLNPLSKEEPHKILFDIWNYDHKTLSQWNLLI
jgi:hypothetical protein